MPVYKNLMCTMLWWYTFNSTCSSVMKFCSLVTKLKLPINLLILHWFKYLVTETNLTIKNLLYKPTLQWYIFIWTDTRCQVCATMVTYRSATWGTSLQELKQNQTKYIFITSFIKILLVGYLSLATFWLNLLILHKFKGSNSCWCNCISTLWWHRLILSFIKFHWLVT